MASAPEEKSSSSAADVIGTAGIIGLLLFLRILAVSRWKWGVASKVTETFEFSDAPAIALGTLFEWPVLTAIVACVVVPIVLLKFYGLYKHPNRSDLLVWSLIVATLFATLAVLVRSFAMWWVIVVIAILTILLLVSVIFYHRGWLHRTAEAAKRGAGTIAVVGLLILAVLVDTPWMPAEDIALTTGKTIHAYVLEDAPGFVTVLTEEDRGILILKDSEIVSRD